MRKKPRRPHPRGRPSPPPPPLTHAPGEVWLPHAVVLDEFRSPAGVALWRALQDVMLYASVAPEARGPALFHDPPGRVEAAPPLVETDLRRLGALVRDPGPEAARLMAATCHGLALWAEDGGHTGTALEFAQAAALADRGNPAYARQVSRIARIRGDVARATVWCRRALVLSRRAGDWEVQALGHRDLGRLFLDMGDAARAALMMERALRIARRYALRDARAEVLWELARLRLARGELAAAAALLRERVRVQGPGSEAVLPLAREIAGHWMDHYRAFGPALAVLREAVAHVPSAEEALPLLVGITRAAGSLGDPELFEIAWMEVWLHVEPEPADALRAGVLLEVARAAAALGDAGRAEVAASRALAVATEQGDAAAAEQAGTVLAALEREASSAGGAPAPASAGEEVPEAEELLEELLAALRKLPRSEDSRVLTLAAALEAPQDPRAAYEVARRARCAAEYTRAEGWYRRAIALGRAAGNWEVVVRSMGGIANLHRQRGNLPLAVSFHQKALVIAREHHLNELEGDTLSDLAAIHFEMEQGSIGFGYVREAVKAYGPHHWRISRIAHDVAVYFMNNGDYTNALSILREIAHTPWPIADVLLRQANTALAAAGAGDLRRFELAWSDARATIKRMGSDEENHAMALVNLAQAALLAGRLEWARISVQRADALARKRKETHALFLAEDLQKVVARVRTTRLHPHPSLAPNHDRVGAAALVEDLAGALRVGTATRGRRAHTRSPRSKP